MTTVSFQKFYYLRSIISINILQIEQDEKDSARFEAYRIFLSPKIISEEILLRLLEGKREEENASGS